MATSETQTFVIKPSEAENIYYTLKIDDLDFEDDTIALYNPCPCGDRFKISIVSVKNIIQNKMKKAVTIANYMSCALKIRVIDDNNYLDKNFPNISRALCQS